MIVGMWMTRHLVVIEPDTPLTAAAQLMADNRIRRLPVARRNGTDLRLLGIVSQSDIYRALPPGCHPLMESPQVLESQKLARDLMTCSVLTTAPDTPIEDAATIMRDRKIGALPVLRDDHLVGLITESDIFRAFISVLKAESSATRVTFAVSTGEDVFQLLAERVRERKVQVSSLMSSRRDGQTVCVARMSGPSVQEVIDDLWKSGHQVINVLQSC